MSVAEINEVLAGVTEYAFPAFRRGTDSAVGHASISAVVKYRPEDGPDWSESPMTRLLNDRWRGEFTVTKIGGFLYTIEAWVDRVTPFAWNFQSHSLIITVGHRGSFLSI